MMCEEVLCEQVECSEVVDMFAWGIVGIYMRNDYAKVVIVTGVGL